MKKQYEEPNLKVDLWNCENILTESEEPVFSGDGWVRDPFEQE